MKIDIETVSSPNGSICYSVNSYSFLCNSAHCIHKFSFHVASKIKKWRPFWNFNFKNLYWDCVFKNMFCMGVHIFNVITFTPFHHEKEIKKWENEKNIQNSDHGERQDHFMISCFIMQGIFVFHFLFSRFRRRNMISCDELSDIKNWSYCHHCLWHGRSVSTDITKAFPMIPPQPPIPSTQHDLALTNAWHLTSSAIT